MSAPRVGVGVFVFKRDGTFILGKRKGSLGAGKYNIAHVAKAKSSFAYR